MKEIYFKKRGAYNALSMIMFVAIVIVAVSVFVVILFNLIYSETDKLDDTSDIFEKKVEITNFDYGPSYIQITLKNVQSKMVVENETYYNVTVAAVEDTDIFSAVDVSGSMDDDCPDVCDKGGSDCWSSDCLNELEDTSCKICDAQNSNIEFINGVLNGSGEHRVGIIEYQNPAGTNVVHPLSSENESLINSVKDLSANGGTCICCGINLAVEELNNSENKGAIVVMSDGEATKKCSEQDTGDSSQDTIEAARRAYEDYGIKVHTIAFGSGANIDTMNQTAIAGNGSFYYGDSSDLSLVYSKIEEEIKKKDVSYKKVGADCLKFIFFNNTKTYQHDVCGLPDIRESRTYIVPEEKNLDEHIINVTKIEAYLLENKENGEQKTGKKVGEIKID